MNWCIASLDKLNNPTNAALEQLNTWYNGTGNIRGVSHDGVNCLFVNVPDDLTGCNTLIVEPSEDEQQLLNTVGHALTNETHDLIIADSAVFTQLFYTPIHKLWCFNYEDKQALESDYIEVFGVDNIDARKSLDTLKVEVRAQIKAVFGSV